MLALEHESLDVGREVGMGLEPVPPGDEGEHEAAPGVLVFLGEVVAQLVDARHRELHQLGQQPGVDGLERGEHHRLDDATRLVRPELVTRIELVRLRLVPAHRRSLSVGRAAP